MNSPATDPVIERIADALAAMRQPDLTGFNEVVVWKVVHQLTDRSVGTSAALQDLRGRITVLSSGLTRLEDVDPAVFQFRSKELGVLYQRLVGQFEGPILIIGDASPQFYFMPSA